MSPLLVRVVLIGPQNGFVEALPVSSSMVKEVMGNANSDKELNDGQTQKGGLATLLART